MVWSRKPTQRTNPFISTKGDHGNKSERRIADDLGAKTTLASGALAGNKGDFELDTQSHYKFKGECKSTVNESISLKKAWLDKIRLEALETNRVPMLTLSFVTPEGKEKPNGDFVVIPKYLFEEIFGE
ncbi:MAG: hypothetical protein GQ570_03525 [Helicobacteraceae bacterium]|nr:hypothetical protein [Helicobacteraceae bacterium]